MKEATAFLNSYSLMWYAMEMKSIQMIKQAASLLSAGKIVAIPTETVYGLAGCARTPSAIQKIYEIKGRPATNPLIIHLSNPPAISDWAINIPNAAWTLVKHFWPGPLTLVLPRHPEVLLSVTAQQNTVALRVPNHPLTLALLQEFGGGLAAPSANRSGRLSPTTAAHVREELGNKVDYILDGGPCGHGIESTIVYFQDNDVFVLRQGSITTKDLESVLNKRVIVGLTHHKNIQVPGRHESHYAPSCLLFLLDRNTLLTITQEKLAQKKRLGIYSFVSAPLFQTADILWCQAKPNADQYAANLYADLRNLDNQKVDCILVEMPPTTLEWAAIMDRLQRAAHKNL